MRGIEFIAGHEIFNGAYNEIFQLKTTLIQQTNRLFQPELSYFYIFECNFLINFHSICQVADLDHCQIHVRSKLPMCHVFYHLLVEAHFLQLQYNFCCEIWYYAIKGTNQVIEYRQKSQIIL